MKEIVLQTIKDEKLFSDLNSPYIKTPKILTYYQLKDYNMMAGKLLIYTQDNKTLYLCSPIETAPATIVSDHYTKIGNKKVFGIFNDKTFIRYKIITSLKLRNKIKFPEADKTYYLNKPIHEKLHAELVLSTADNIEINMYVSPDDNTDEGYLAYKLKGKWGFLYYERTDNGDYTFDFKPINNFIDGNRLVQTNEGYKDFTYFIKSQSLPKAYKIGRAENPDHRFKAIQAHNARELTLDLLLADGRLEIYFHNKFDHLRISNSREWFEIGDDLVEFITKESKRIKYLYNLFDKSNSKKTIINNFNN